MRAHEVDLVNQLETGLSAFGVGCPLPGAGNAQTRRALVLQLVDSMRRVRFVQTASNRALSQSRLDPASNMFDPIRGAIVCRRARQIEEGSWLVFLATHFGKHRVSGWRYVREVYGALGQQPSWTWARVVGDVGGFRQWLSVNRSHLERGKQRGFGNHRKYESLDAYSKRGTGSVVASYVDLINQYGSHQSLFSAASENGKLAAHEAFHRMYGLMAKVVSFGRTARFDYLTMLGKTGLASLVPASPYLAASTGPKRGAALLFGHASVEELEAKVVSLGLALGVGMQELEDALCNWQKSPEAYKAFRG